MALKCETVAYPVVFAVVLVEFVIEFVAAGAHSTRLQKQYTPMSSRGRDLYPSLHTRHTSAASSSSSSSEMSSIPSMLVGDTATVNMS